MYVNISQAQFLIFEKMREEGFVSGTDDVRLTVEIMVASTQVGRIIGKGGQNVREMQRITGSLIKLPEQGAAQPDQDTTVHIIGPFFSVQVCFIFKNFSLRVCSIRVLLCNCSVILKEALKRFFFFLAIFLITVLYVFFYTR